MTEYFGKFGEILKFPQKKIRRKLLSEIERCSSSQTKTRHKQHKKNRIIKKEIKLSVNTTNKNIENYINTEENLLISTYAWKMC